MALAARPDGAARDQLDHRREREFARGLGAGEMLADAAMDARQHVGKPGQAPRLAHLAHLLPFRMVPVLQPAGGIAADRLQVRTRILGVEHVGIGGRHSQAGEPPHLGAIADHAPGGIEVAPAFAAPATADRQCVGADEP
jgi:hypothetical protein